MFLTAFDMLRCDRERVVGYAPPFGPNAGVRASLSPSPAITGAHGGPARDYADDAIDLDTGRAGVAHEQTDGFARLVWGSLSRLFCVSETTSSSREPICDASPCQPNRNALSPSHNPDASFEPFEM